MRIQVFLINLIIIIFIGSLQAETKSVLLGMENFNVIGKVKPRRSEEIQSSRWGIHFNKYRLPELELMLEKTAESGLKWARIQTFDFALSPDQGYYDWEELDPYIDGLIKRDIEIFITFDEVIIEDWKEYEYPIKDELIEKWLEYVKVLVNRYHDRVKYWEILNEPFLNKNYAKMVIQASKAVKKIDPDAIIITGSIARMDIEGLELILNEGVGPHSDVITFHPYSEFPESIKYPFIYSIKRPEDYVMASNLLSDMQTLIAKESRPIKLWQGECGYPSAANSSSWQGRGPWGENIQSKWLARRFMTDLSLDIPVSVYFVLRVPPEKERINEKGLLRFGTHEPKPGYHTLQFITSIFDQDLNEPMDVQSSIKVLKAGSFYGIRNEYPESFGAPYSKAKAPTPIEVTGVAGKKGNAIVYWLPWRMQEIVKPAFINLNVENIKVENPVLVDLLSGKVYHIQSKVVNGQMIFSNVPLADYPMVIMNKESVLMR